MRIAKNCDSRHAERQHIKQQLAVVQEIAKLLDRPLDPPRTVQSILRILSQMLGLNCGRVLAPNDAGSVLEVKYSYGLTHERLARGAFSVGYHEGVTGFVMRTGTTGLVSNIDDEPLYLQRITERSGTNLEPIAFIAVPILELGTPIGVLSVQRQGNRQRAFDNDISVLRVAASAIGQVMRIRKFLHEKTEQLMQENQSLKNSIAKDAMLQKSLTHGIVGSSDSLMEAVKQCLQVSQSGAPVMLLGESGTGKEKFARMIHQLSDRHEQAFVCINCAAIPADLLEAELFGYERGSFTGANTAKKGKIALADKGTLFLDEIGDMPLQLQSKLLRVIQEQQLDPIGSTRSLSVDFRLITATHVDMQEYVNAGHFRLDLFYRINVVPVYLPPLRIRREDIRLLALHFLQDLNHRYSRNITLHPEAMQVLLRYSWPGNVRQLQNVLERAVLMGEDNVINHAEMNRILAEQGTVKLHKRSPSKRDSVASEATMENHAFSPMRDEFSAMPARSYRFVHQNDADRILAALDNTHGNQAEAARRLGLTARQLRYRIKKLGLV